MTLPNSADPAPVGAHDAGAQELHTVELVPAPPPGPGGVARIVGPGRRERDYLKRVTHLQDLLQYERERQSILERELGASVRVERGAQRRLDRLEERMEQSQARERRLAALMGALQRDNELLRGRVLELETAAAALLPASTAPARAGFWARLFGSAPASKPARRRDA